MNYNAKILEEARELLIQKGWTKGAFARKADRRSVNSYNPDAVCFCALGAVARAAKCSVQELEFDPVWDSLCAALPTGVPHTQEGIIQFNDNADTTLPDIIDFLTKAIIQEYLS